MGHSMNAFMNDRRLHRRYRTTLEAELRTQENESIPCRIVDISATGAAVQCENISDELSIVLRLEGFGALSVSRLRTGPGTERLIIRETESRIRQFILFISDLLQTGRAMPILTRRRPLEDQDEGLASSYAFDVRQTIRLMAQVANRDGTLPDNVALFCRPDRRSTSQPPDLIA